MKRRFFSFLLTLCMVLALMPTTVRAEAATAHTDHCICGASHTDVGDHDTESEQSFEAWDSTDSLPDRAGCFYLTENVTLSRDEWKPANGTVLCLNGKTIKGDPNNPPYNLIVVNAGVNFTLTDCASSDSPGKIVSTGSDGAVVIKEGGTFTMYGGSIADGNVVYGGMVDVRNSGTFTMNGGSISNNKRENAGEYTVSGVYVHNGGKFTMNKGSISGNTFASNGGGVYIGFGGTFDMNGGSIKGNKAVSQGIDEMYGDGGGVYNRGTFTMKGGEITGNSASKNGGGVYNEGNLSVSGGVIIMSNTAGTNGNENNVFLCSDKKITMTADVLTGGTGETHIGVTTETLPADGSFVTIADVTGNIGNNASCGNRVFSDNQDYRTLVRITDDAPTVVLQKNPASGSDPVTPAAPVNGKGLGVSILADPTAPASTSSAWAGSYVYFGTYDGNPVKYRVLDRNTTAFGGTTMLLDCDSILSKKEFGSSNVWGNSSIKSYLNGEFLTGTNFTALERAAIAESTKASKSGTDGVGQLALEYSELTGQKIFLLDAMEASNTSYGYSNTSSQAENRKKTYGNGYNNWWLRSASSGYLTHVGIVSSSGDFDVRELRDEMGVSPAMNVNLSSVIFSSVLSGTAGQPGAEYKLTLYDDTVTIDTNGTITRNQRNEITVPYTLRTTSSSPTNISLMVLDQEYTQGNTNNAKLLSYQTVSFDRVTCTATFTLPENIPDGSKYYIVAEKVNAGSATDYASEPKQITIPEASAATFTVTVADGTLSNGSSSGEYAQGDTVTITANAAPEGQQFKEWTVESGTITLADSTSTTTTFTMPAEAVSVKANYEAIPVTEYLIKASAGANGNISPGGDVKVAAGGSQTFTISPSSGYKIDTLKVDGTEVAASASYTFSNVNANHTIEVTFVQESKSPDASDGDSDNSDTPAEPTTPDTSDPVPDNTTPAKEMGLTGGYWMFDDGKWWYAAADGSYPSNGWTKIDGEWYAFDTVGYMETGWYRSKDDWYYLGDSGAMQTGWVLDDDNWYYMNESGIMETGWVLDGDTWYYMAPNGAMCTTWIWDGKHWYYMAPNGAMCIGWLWDGANWYYMDENGAMQTGWIWDGKHWYYMYYSGAMAHDVVIGGYRLNESGAWMQ